MSRRAPEEVEYDAIVYWRNRLRDEHADLMADTALPPDIRTTILAELGATLGNLAIEIVSREATLETRP